jgi:hypothetical protein
MLIFLSRFEYFSMMIDMLIMTPGKLRTRPDRCPETTDRNKIGGVFQTFQFRLRWIVRKGSDGYSAGVEMSTLPGTSNAHFFIRARRAVRFIPSRAMAPVGRR